MGYNFAFFKFAPCFSSSRQKHLRSISIPAMLSVGLLMLAGTKLKADSGIWIPQEGSTDWNTAANWTSGTVPNGAGQVATFTGNGSPIVTLSGNTFPDSINFTSPNSGYVIDTSTFTLALSGAGIEGTSNYDTLAVGATSGIGQGILGFAGSASAGSGTHIVDLSSGGFTEFTATSTAGSAVLSNQGGGANIGSGGFAGFGNTSSAGTASIVNYGATSVGSNGGRTNLFDSSTASHATFVNVGSTVQGEAPGFTVLQDSATASTATFINENGSGVSAFTYLEDKASGGTATFQNLGGGTALDGGKEIGPLFGGMTVLAGSSTAASGTFNTGGGTASGATGGAVILEDTATAGSATFNTYGGSVSGAGGGNVMFTNNSSAGTSTLIANGGTNGSAGATINFTDTSDGELSAVKVYGNGGLDISSHAAGTVNIGSLEGSGGVSLGANTLSVGANNEDTDLSGVISDAGLAGSLTKVGTGTLSLDGANTYTGATTVTAGTLQVSGSLTSNSIVNGGATLLYDAMASAGATTITSNGGTTPDGLGGTVIFNGNSTAGSSTFIINGGTNGGIGGYVGLGGNSTGGTSSVKVYGTGDFAIDGNANKTVSIGSLEGSGGVYLGSNTLSVGGNNASKLFTGVIVDSGTGGSFIKTGTGNLILGGANTYTGPTTIAGGGLEVDGSIKSAPTVEGGATLAGQGSVGNITLQSGGFIAPGSYGSHTATTLTASSLMWEGGGVLKFDIGGPASDFLSLSGALDTDSGDNGPFTFNFSNFGSDNGRTFDLIGFTSENIPLSDFESQAGDGVNGTFSYDNNELQFTVGATPPVVPEPSTWALALLGLLSLIAFRGRLPAHSHRE